MKKIYSVNDNKANYYLPPMVMRNHDEAIRSFKTACEQEGSQFKTHPNDFTFVCVAEWDEDTGTVIPLEKPLILANGGDFVENNM